MLYHGYFLLCLKGNNHDITFNDRDITRNISKCPLSPYDTTNFIVIL